MAFSSSMFFVRVMAFQWFLFFKVCADYSSKLPICNLNEILHYGLVAPFLAYILWVFFIEWFLAWVMALEIKTFLGYPPKVQCSVLSFGQYTLSPHYRNHSSIQSYSQVTLHCYLYICMLVWLSVCHKTCPDYFSKTTGVILSKLYRSGWYQVWICISSTFFSSLIFVRVMAL